ncbi:MAG: alpha/beta hydrolase [Actinobacteria bacterium]|nr:alpha/beta hydrolase [Actinomycetota bacterium]
MVTAHPIQRWGEQGSEVLLVHGSVANGEMTWGEQRPLADRWQLVVIDRRGYFPSAPIDHEDFAEDVPDVVELLGQGAHLVGHSYDAVISLLAAAERPEAVRSLTVIEPPAFGVTLDHPAVKAFAASPAAAAAPAERGAADVERDPTEAVIPLERLREAEFPKLVVSGAHSAAFDAVCDVLEKEAFLSSAEAERTTT